MFPGHQKLNIHTKFRKCPSYIRSIYVLFPGGAYFQTFVENAVQILQIVLVSSLLTLYIFNLLKKIRYNDSPWTLYMCLYCWLWTGIFVVNFEKYFAGRSTALYLLSSLKTNESACTLSQNLYVSQHTKTGTLYDFATMATIADPALDMTLPLASSACAPSSTHVT